MAAAALYRHGEYKRRPFHGFAQIVQACEICGWSLVLRGLQLVAALPTGIAGLLDTERCYHNLALGTLAALGRRVWNRSGPHFAVALSCVRVLVAAQTCLLAE
jgi:hypothetical protein